MMAVPVSGVAKAVAFYGRQQTFADRAARIHTPKTVQVTAPDRVSISAEASVKAGAAGAYSSAVAAQAPPPSRHDIAETAKKIYYDNPRKGAKEEPTEDSGKGGNVDFIAGLGTESTERKE